jgi:hypothetical protein
MVKKHTIYTSSDGTDFLTFKEAQDREGVGLVPCRFCKNFPRYEVGSDATTIQCCNVHVRYSPGTRLKEAKEKATIAARVKWNTLMGGIA